MTHPLFSISFSIAAADFIRIQRILLAFCKFSLLFVKIYKIIIPTPSKRRILQNYFTNLHKYVKIYALNESNIKIVERLYFFVFERMKSKWTK